MSVRSDATSRARAASASARRAPDALDAPDAVPPGLVLLLGLPGSGKTSCARALSAMLGRPALSAGDLLRERFSVEPAFAVRWIGFLAGHVPIDPDVLAAVLDGPLTRTGGTAILDAGPPVEGALRSLGIVPAATLWLHCRRDERRRRFSDRARPEGPGIGDHAALFERRERLLRARLGQTFERLATVAPLIPIDANGDQPSVAFQAISALCSARALAAPLGAERAGTGRESAPDDLVLLVKPGARRPELAAEAALSAFAQFGWVATRRVMHPGCSIARTGRGIAHLGTHFVHAAWPALAMREGAGQNGASPDSAAIDPFAIARRDGLAELARVWTARSGPRRLGSGRWVSDPEPGGRPVSNGHVPAMLADLHYPSHAVHALLLRARLGAAPLRTLRCDVLGHATAPAPGTLRHTVLSGELDVGLDPAPHRNGYHLSASAAEARREASIWFGLRRTPFSDIACDRPVWNAPGRWLFDAVENGDWSRCFGAVGAVTDRRHEAGLGEGD